MANVRLDGVILPLGCGDPDRDMRAAIERGECTDYATLKARLTDAEQSGEPVTLRVNCLGGDTMAAAMMGIALSQCRAPLSVEVEAIAASAAANLLALLPKGVLLKVHPQSLIMYHGCSTLAIGGAGALRDAARQAEAYNETVIRALKERTSLDERTVDTWFEEGREGWLNAEEAVACGLASEMMDGSVETPAAMVAVEGAPLFAMAAFAARIKEEMMAKTTECTPETPKAEEPKEPTMEERIEMLERENAALKAERDELKAKLAEGGGMEEPETPPTAEDGDQTEEDERLGERVKMLEEKIASLESVNARLTAGLTTPATPATAQKSFIELVRDIPKGLTAREYSARFEALKRDHSKEYEEYMESHQTR